MSLDLSIGSSRTRTPVARDTAFATAAAPGTAGGSPARHPRPDWPHDRRPRGPDPRDPDEPPRAAADAAAPADVLGSPRRALAPPGRDPQQLAPSFARAPVHTPAEAVGGLASGRH